MGLNKSVGNMYNWVTHTFNTIKGVCPHACSYCFVKRFGNQPELHFDRKELKTDLGEGNFIFIGSSCDMFSEKIPGGWIIDTLRKMNEYDNKYLLQTKNPARFSRSYIEDCKRPIVICTTIETNRLYPEIMNNCPSPQVRSISMELIRYPKYVTIEPIMDFDLDPMVELIKRCDPVQVNIGADSGNNNLPEPPIDKVLELVDRLSKFTVIARKRNLNRLLKEKQ